MDLLPEEHERRALLDGLATIIEAAGFERFVAAPLLEPDSRFFPDPWEASARGVRALTLRLLRYAGGDGQDAVVSLYDESLGRDAHEGAIAWFAGIEDETCVFGVHTSQLLEHDAIVGTLCHEVAHAYRSWTGLVQGQDRLEEENTDLTTIYLGFGLLTTNNAYRFRKRGLRGNQLAGTEWSTAVTGYLSPQAMAFALAAQVTARGLSVAQAKRIGRLLETNQEAFFEAACEMLRVDVDGLRTRLGLPPEPVWPEPWPLQFDALPDDAHFDPRDREAEPGRSGWNEGRNVFRVRERSTRTFPYAVAGVPIGFFASLAACHHLFSVESHWALICSGTVGALALGSVGSRRTSDSYWCSDPKCAVRLPMDATSCPRCRGRIRGVIGHRNERLAAEDALSPSPAPPASPPGFGRATRTPTDRKRSNRP